MTETEQQTAPVTTVTNAAVWRSRISLILIVAIFLLPLLSAWWLYSRTQHGALWGTVNNGELLEPLIVPSLRLLHTDGTEFQQSDLFGKWTLVYAPDMPCLEDCQRVIYHLRHIWALLGRESPRVQRLLLLQQQAQYAELQEFLVNYPNMQTVFESADQTGLREFILQHPQLTEISEPARAAAVYLIDPLGHVMMRFAADLDARDIFKDLKKLLKASKIG